MPSVSDTATNLDHLDAQQLREMVQSLMGQVQANKLEIQRRDHEIAFKQAAIDKLTHEMAVLKRLKFAAKSEAFTAEQKSLLEESIDADLAALERELEQIAPAKTAPQDKQQPKRQVLPVNLPRREIHHEPQSATCACGCRLERIGEDVSEKLDYQPGVFTVERHVRGKWVCARCETLIQAPVAPHIIDKGIPTAGLLAQVLVAKYLDHLPLYRQEAIFGRAGLAVPRSTLAPGLASAACNCSRWWTRSSARCSRTACCMPTRRRWRCSSPATARHIGPTSGATARRPTAPACRGVRLRRRPRRPACPSLPRSHG